MFSPNLTTFDFVMFGFMALVPVLFLIYLCLYISKKSYVSKSHPYWMVGLYAGPGILLIVPLLIVGVTGIVLPNIDYLIGFYTLFVVIDILYIYRIVVILREKKPVKQDPATTVQPTEPSSSHIISGSNQKDN